MSGLAFEFSDQLLDQLADAVARRLADRDQPTGDTGWLRGAENIAAHIGAPASRVYALAGCTPPRIPVHRDGSALVANRGELDAWVRAGGGKRP